MFYNLHINVDSGGIHSEWLGFTRNLVGMRLKSGWGVPWVFPGVSEHWPAPWPTMVFTPESPGQMTEGVPGQWATRGAELYYTKKKSTANIFGYSSAFEQAQERPKRIDFGWDILKITQNIVRYTQNKCHTLFEYISPKYYLFWMFLGLFES